MLRFEITLAFGPQRGLIGEMRSTLGWSMIAAFVLATPAAAQQPTSPVSIDAIRAALQRSAPPLVISSAAPPPEVHLTRLGVLTLVPPDRNGEMVKVAIPIGELTTRAVRAVSNAQRRRAERAAERRVLEDLRAFQARKP
jgi:hypothetical protein